MHSALRKPCALDLQHVTCRWEDGQRVRRQLERINRWEVHAAEEIDIAANGINVHLRPQPHLLSAAKVGVGACLWDSSIVLTAYLGTLKQIPS
jgi:hypothetical protein